MSFRENLSKLERLDVRQGAAILRAIGIRGGIRMLLASRKTTYKLPFIISRNSRVDISDSAELDVNTPLMFGMKLNRMTDHWQGGSTLRIRDDATFEITEEGDLARIGPNSTVNVSGNFKMGGTSYMYSDAHITCHKSVSIGENCAIARGFSARDADVHTLRVEGEVANSPESVTVKDNVWIGTNVSLKKGVTVGEGSVIASNSVVTEDVPPNTLVAGVPAEPIRENISWEG